MHRTASSSSSRARRDNDADAENDPSAVVDVRALTLDDDDARDGAEASTATDGVDVDDAYGPTHWTRERRKSVREKIAHTISVAVDAHNAACEANEGDTGAPVDVSKVSATFATRALLSGGAYDADARAWLRAYAKSKNMPWRRFASAEDSTARAMRMSVANGDEAETDGETTDAENSAASYKYWTRVAKVTAASAIGGGLLFFTGGIAAPAIVASLNGLGVIGATGAGLLTTLGGVSAVFGATGAGLTGYKMMRRTSSEMEVFNFVPIRGVGKRFALHVYVPGFLRDGNDLLGAWGVEKNAYTVVIHADGALGIRLEHDDTGERMLIVCTHEDSTEDDDGTSKPTGLASAAGVISQSELISARSLNDALLSKQSSSLRRFSSGNNVMTMSVEDLEALPRPLELRLRRPEGNADIVETLVEEMSEIVLDAPLKEHSEDKAKTREMVNTKWENTTGEQYVLEWETTTLTALGAAMQFVGGRFAIAASAPHVLAQTALASIAAAVAWPVTLVTASNYLDDPWTIAKSKAEIAGEEIAHALLSKAHGRRPVTLVSYSMGAYVVQSALQKLYDAGDKGRNIVERVVFISAPLSCSERIWQPMREVVSGRLINVHCSNDWILMFLYRLKAIDPTTALAGLSPVHGAEVENFEMSIKHASLPDHIAYILKSCGVEE